MPAGFSHFLDFFNAFFDQFHYRSIEYIGNLFSYSGSDDRLTDTTVTVVSLLSREGLAYMFTGAVRNFTAYAPLGMVLVAMLISGVRMKPFTA